MSTAKRHFSFILFLFLCFMISRQVFAAPEILLPKVETYDQLVSAIREARVASRGRVEQAVEQEKVREAWEIGRLVDEHVFLHKERADYGKYVVGQLAADLGMSRTELYYMLEFARTYPIVPAPGQLSWSHYRLLLSVNDGEKREAISKRATDENWTGRDLEREIKKLEAANPGTVTEDVNEEPLVPLKGELNTYRIVTAVAGEWLGKPVIDLGFSNYHRPPGNFPFHEGDIIHVKNGKLELAKEASESLQPLQIPQRTAPTLSADAAVLAQPAQVFSYRAYALEITDGDTLWALIDLGFGFTTKQHLRLRGIDASEINSREGMQAKRFVEQELLSLQGEAETIPAPITIASSKSDKYDRYLADVFYVHNDEEAYLNNKLLQAGLATRAES